MREEIEPPSKLKVGLFLLPKGGVVYEGGGFMSGVDRTQHRFLMRGVIMPPSTLIVTNKSPHPKTNIACFIRGYY